MIKKIVILAASVLMSTGLYAASAAAGLKNGPSVSFTTSGSVTTAKGQLGAAHNSNDKQEIGCRLRTYNDFDATPPAATYEADCKAVKADGTSTTCQVSGWAADITNPDYPNMKNISFFAHTIGMINGSSYVEFEHQNGVCTSITVDNNSQYTPKDADTKDGDGLFDIDSTLDPLGDGAAFSFSGAALSSVRGSGDTTQYLGCYTSYLGTLLEAGCFLNTPSNVYKYCTTNRANDVWLISMLKPDTWLSFSASDDGGECGRVEIGYSSRWNNTH